jgi:ABC-2 type transport system permease protein
MRYLKLYWGFLGQELKQAMADRGDFLLGFLTILLYQALTLALVGVIFLNVPEVRGWRFAEVLFILGFFHVTSGLFYMHFAWTLWFADRYILRRQLDHLLTRPLNPYFQVMAEGLGVSMQEVFSCLLGAVMMAVASSLLDFNWGIEEILWLAMGIVVGVVILGGLFSALAALSFWMVGSASMAHPLMSLMDFAQYPLEIYGRHLRAVLTFAVPLGFMAFYPSAGILREGYQQYMLIGATLATIFGGGGYGLWRLGLRRYESAGH